MAGDRCDMCQDAEYDVSTIVRKDGQTTWLCWACYPYAQAQYLAAVGWSVEPPTTPEAEPAEAETAEAEPAGRPARRPRVVTGAEAAPPGAADPTGLATPAADPDDQRRADRLESGGRAGQKSGPPPAGA